MSNYFLASVPSSPLRSWYVFLIIITIIIIIIAMIMIIIKVIIFND